MNIQEELSNIKEEHSAALDTITMLEASSPLLESLEPIGSLLTSFLGIIMKWSHPITCLCAIVNVLCEQCIFGVAVTSTVLD